MWSVFLPLLAAGLYGLYGWHSRVPLEYDFPIASGNGSVLFPMHPCRGVQLEEASIDHLQALMTSRTLSSVDLLDCYMNRVFQTSNYLKYAPFPPSSAWSALTVISAIIQLNPDALEIAKSVDEERAQGKTRGRLHGIPFIVKDNIATKDRMETTSGSWALLGSVVPRDAHVVRQLRKAGAVLLGKAALSEWADMRSNTYSEGYSGRGGQCRSAYNLTVNPGGSSSGSGVAVGANLVPFALGTDTDGSVINPAQRNAIVGIRSTVDLTSRAGTIPESLNQDTIGTFGKTVRDAVYALDAIYGVDHRDKSTLVQQGKTPSGGYAQFLSNKTALQGAVFGLPWASLWSKGDPDQISQLMELLDLIKEAGATIISGTELPHHQAIIPPTGWDWDYGSKRGYPNESEYSYIKVDFYNDIKAYLAQLENTSMRSLEDLVAYNILNAGSEGGHPGVHPAFASGQDGFEASVASKGVMDETYWQALAFCRRTTREEGIDAALWYGDRVLDGLLVPMGIEQSSHIAAQAGYPVITIPAGVNRVSGMPYGSAFMHTAFSESTLVKYASAIEDLQMATRTPWKRTLPEWRGHLIRNIPILKG